MGSEKMCGLIIGVASMSVKEEDLGFELASSTGPTEETYFLHPAIPIHISRRHVVDYPVTGEVPVKILGAIFCLVKNYSWNESLAISSGEYQSSTP